jgi:hypothetical protein
MAAHTKATIPTAASHRFLPIFPSDRIFPSCSLIRVEPTVLIFPIRYPVT